MAISVPIVIRAGGTRRTVPIGEAIRLVEHSRSHCPVPPSLRETIDREAVAEDYRDGLPTREIRLKHGISGTTLGNIVRAAGVPSRGIVRPVLSPETIAAIVRDRQDGATYADLQARYGIAYRHLADLLAERGIGRPPTPAQRRAAEIRARIAAGETISGIARETSISVVTIRKVRDGWGAA